MDEQELELLEEKQSDETVEQAAEQQARRAADVRDFLAEYPGVRPDEIPDEVWEEVRQGRPLTEAFRRWLNRQLRAENRSLRDRLAADATNRWNQRRSLGSQRSSGRGGGRDVFLEALLGDE